MEIEYIYKILTELNKFKEYNEIAEVINDINLLNNMIANYPINYSEYIVNNILDKYKNEINFLRSIEIKYTHSNNVMIVTEYQQLLNLRHCLIRIGILRVAKRKGKELGEEIIKDNSIVYNILIKLI